MRHATVDVIHNGMSAPIEDTRLLMSELGLIGGFNETDKLSDSLMDSASCSSSEADGLKRRGLRLRDMARQAHELMIAPNKLETSSCALIVYVMIKCWMCRLAAPASSEHPDGSFYDDILY